MTVLLLPNPDERIRQPLDVALVNNMPDGAFLDTERQFRSMLASGGARVRLRLHTLTSIPRSAPTASQIRSRYRSLDQLWDRPPDALIVTGTEPREADLRRETYWPELARLLEWAAEAVPTVLVSCLAAHASLLLFDGIERVRRPSKCCGVFRGSVDDDVGGLAEGLPSSMPLPHSRLNDVPESALEAAGYRIVVGSGESGAGWAVAARDCGRALFVLCQAHPEYGTLSLLREYRRDVRRYLFGRTTVAYPRVPEGYLGPQARLMLERFASRTLAGRGDRMALWGAFPYDEVAERVENTWGAASAILYANWIAAARAAAAVPV